MEVALAVIIAIVAVGFLGTWYYALWRGWRHASRDQTPVERRIVVSGVAALILLPVALAVVGASDGAAIIAIAVAMAVVLPVLIIIGARDHRRRAKRIREGRHGTSDGDD
jgi:O-antigen/teichoic acid export membrane protein